MLSNFELSQLLPMLNMFHDFTEKAAIVVPIVLHIFVAYFLVCTISCIALSIFKFGASSRFLGVLKRSSPLQSSFWLFIRTSDRIGSAGAAAANRIAIQPVASL